MTGAREPTSQTTIRTADVNDATLLAELIRKAFHDVALQFGLTPDNAPSHPSNCEPSWIERDIARGLRYQVLCLHGDPVGCVGLEPAADERFSFQRLAVLPERRGHGLGRQLVDSALEAARQAHCRSVRIGIVADHRALGDWYRGMGFVDAERRSFSHLPFEVLYLTLELDPGA